MSHKKDVKKSANSVKLYFDSSQKKTTVKKSGVQDSMKSVKKNLFADFEKMQKDNLKKEKEN